VKLIIDAEYSELTLYPDEGELPGSDEMDEYGTKILSMAEFAAP
jgi:hypothetical protein